MKSLAQVVAGMRLLVAGQAYAAKGRDLPLDHASVLGGFRRAQGQVIEGRASSRLA